MRFRGTSSTIATSHHSPRDEHKKESLKSHKKSNCNCGFDECLGFCESLDLDSWWEDASHFPIDDAAGVISWRHHQPDDIDVILQNLLKDDDDDAGKSDSGKKFSTTTETPRPKKRKAGAIAHVEEQDSHDDESHSEKNRKREQNRRNDVNKGFEKLTSLIFVIDPLLKEKAKERQEQQGAAVAGRHLLSRVELVNIALATLTRLHEENEYLKKSMQQKTRGIENGGAPGGLIPAPSPGGISPPSLQASQASLVVDKPSTSEEHKEAEDSVESKTERKRNKERRRRNQVNEGLDRLTSLVFVVDPPLKAAAKERALKNHSGSRKPKTESQLLSRVELLVVLADIMARIHRDNTARKMFIACFAAKNGSTMTGGEAPPFPPPPSTSVPTTPQEVVTEPAGTTNDDCTKEDGPPTKRHKADAHEK